MTWQLSSKKDLFCCTNYFLGSFCLESYILPGTFKPQKTGLNWHPTLLCYVSYVSVWHLVYQQKKRLDLIEPMLTLAFFLANDVLMLASKASQATVCIVMRLRKQHSLALLCVSKADSQCSTGDLAFMRHLHVLGRLWKRLLNEKSVVGKRRHFSFTSNHERNNKQLRKSMAKKWKRTTPKWRGRRERMLT